MGNVESDELTKQVNLQSFSSPYSPQFFINKNDFKGKSIKQVMKEYLNSNIIENPKDNEIQTINNKNLNEINMNISEKKEIKQDNKGNNSQKDMMKISSIIPSLSTLDEEIKSININSISASISTKNEIKKRE